MSLKPNQPSLSGGVQSAFKRLDPAKYTSLGDFIDEVNRPDIREALAKTYRDQGITGFLQMTGAIKSAGTADKVQWWEEARLHARQTGDWIAGGKIAVTVADEKIFTRVNDVLLIGTKRYLVTDVAAVGGNNVTSYNLTVVDMGGTGANPTSGAVDAAIIGNLYGQGSSQPTEYLESNVVLRENPYSILKETFKVTGSQATNIGYINLGNGDYRWYIKGEMDTRQRFLDKREMMMLLGQKKATDVTVGDFSVNGSEGYFAAIEDRGIVQTGGVISSLVDFDAIVTELDKQGSAPEYCMYANTEQMLAIDDMVATLNGAAGFGDSGASIIGNPTNGAAAFGSFTNAEQAVKLGFKSFGRGGYTFHNKSWKLLNDPTLLGGSSFKGVMIPMTSVIDPKSGARAAALEMNYKAVDGYSREMEHWMTGSILGVSNTNEDSLQFNYRSECNLVTRAANQHVLIK